MEFNINAMNNLLLQNGYKRRFKKGLTITFVAITNDIPIIVAMTRGILVLYQKKRKLKTMEL